MKILAENLRKNCTDNFGTYQINWPKVSVIVVTKDHHDFAIQAVNSILKTDYPSDRRQIVVVEEIENPHPIIGRGVDYYSIPVKNLGVGYARNTAVKCASHRILVFTDDDCIVEKQWLKEIIRPLIKFNGIAATAGAVLIPSAGPIGKCENILGFPGGGLKYLHRANGKMRPMSTFSTCNCAISLDHVKDFYFGEGFMDAGEDEQLSRSISANHKILYNPFAIVKHKPRDNLYSVFLWFIRRGQSRVEMIKHIPNKYKYIYYLIITSPIFRLILTVMLCFTFELSYLFVLTVIWIVYYSSVIWRFKWAWKYYPCLKSFFVLPVVKMIMDFGMDIGFLKSILKSKIRINAKAT